MAPCDACGWENASDVVFCANPECQRFLGWRPEESSPSEPDVHPAVGGTTRVEATGIPQGPAAIPPPAGRVRPQQQTAAKTVDPTIAKPARPPRQYKLVRERQEPVLVVPSAGPDSTEHRRSGSGTTDGRQGLYFVMSTREVAVDPGGTASIEARIRNTGALVERVELDVQGVPAEWVSVAPGDVNLDVGTETAVVVQFHPPRQPGTRSSRYPIEVTCWSSTNPNVRCTERGSVDVGGFDEAAAHLDPRALIARREASMTLVVVNRGNRSLSAVVTASDAEDRLDISCHPRQITVAPSSEEAVRVTVTPTQRHLSGLPVIHQLDVVVDVHRSEPLRAESTFTQVPLLPRWVPRAVALVAAAAVLVGGLVLAQLLTKDESEPSGTTASAPSAPATVTLPDLEGQPAAEARATLEGQGLLVEFADDQVTDGVVTSQEPTSGTPVEPGQTVTLTVGASASTTITASP